MEFIKSILVSAIFFSVVHASPFCCEPNEFVLDDENLCWKPMSDVYSNLTVQCESSRLVGANFELQQDNSLKWILEFATTYLPPDVFCIGNQTSISLSNVTDPSNFTEVLIICLSEEEDKNYTKTTLQIISIICLFFTILIYSAISELRDLLGKSIISFALSLCLGLMCLVAVEYMDYSDMNFCAFMGFTTYFFITSSFFWMNSIAIQVLRSTRKPCTTDSNWKEFLFYALYSWVCPSLLTAITAIVNYHPGTHDRPGIGLNHCWFIDLKQQWIYLYSIVSILTLVNVAIFIYTASIVWRLTFSSSHVQAVKLKLMMTIRLVLLLGVPWVFEMISSLTSEHIIWTIIDSFNCLQGLWVFLLLVVFRKRVIKGMHSRGWLLCLSRPAERWLAVGEADENVVQHTELPTHDR